jgi:Putative auto-transporter adhesin, head GIN domain
MKLLDVGIVLLAMGCLDLGVVGNGHALADVRSVSAFTAVEASISLDVVIAQDPTTSVVVTTDANLAPLITTVVVGGTLQIHQNGDIDPRTPSIVTVHLPALTAADHGGSGSMTISGFSGAVTHFGAHGSGGLTASIQADALDVASDGSGSATVIGSTQGLTMELAGSGSVDATGLMAHGANASLAGSGSGALTASGNVNLDISGSGSFRAELDDGSAWLSVSGSGSIVWSGDSQLMQETSTGSGSIVHR